MRYFTFFLLIIICTFSGSTLSHAQNIEDAPYDPTQSPQNNFLYKQLKNIPTTQRPAISPEHIYKHKMNRQEPEAETYANLLPRPTLIDNPEPSSPLESYYKTRINEPLTQFGYDYLKPKPQTQLDNPQYYNRPIGVQDDYVLGSGDRIIFTFTGEKRGRELYVIDQQGQLVIEDLEPLLAAGKTILQLRHEVNALLKLSFHDTHAFMSLERVKDIRVTIMGEAVSPGQYILSSYGNLLDALTQAKGIKKTGSLRHIKKLRGTETTLIDLYGLFLGQNHTPALDLRDGDKIIIPPIGQTVAVTGAITRPAIYEISSHDSTRQQTLKLDHVLNYAAGALSTGQNRVTLSSIDTDGNEHILRLSTKDTRPLKNGDIIKIENTVPDKQHGVTLLGAVRHAGLHNISKQDTLAALLGPSSYLNTDAYPFFAVIERYNPKTLSQELISFSPKDIFAGKENHPIYSKDRIIIFDHDTLLPFITHMQEEEPVLKDDTIQENIQPNTTILSTMDETVEPSLSTLLTPHIEKLIKTHSISLRGAVNAPGTYPISSQISAQEILDYAGGLNNNADKTRIEITRNIVLNKAHDTAKYSKRTERISLNLDKSDATKIHLRPQDTIRVHEQFSDLKGASHTVRITGEVLYPGYYDLARDETLLDLIMRAGGLTAVAYPDGAIFSRSFERKRESQEFKNQALEIERAIAASLSEKEPINEEINFLKATVERLNNLKPTGRITVEADPTVLRVKPAQNILLEADDHIHIPKRAITVRVTGEVLSPTVLQFKSQKKAMDYIKEAGGFTRNADRGKAYVIFPDGSATPLDSLSWASTASETKIPPMSTIYVPRDPKPFDFIQTTRDFTQILTNLAITGIFLDDIADD